ncbi:hypothetical protein V7R84_12315 [Arachnia propionica]|uniref:hypothetical protein n=1 Tax=Arachnia propionica TaxID=1750 RepID=UPI0030D5D9E9
MFRRFPHIAVASLAALTIGLSACSNTTPTASPSANQQTTSRTSPAATNPESTADTAQKTADPDLASKILTGEVAGVTLKEMPEIPDLDSALKGADVQVEPDGCLNTGITQLVAGATSVTQTGVVSLLLSSDSAVPGKYKEYAQKCASASGTVAGSPVKQSIEKQQAPAVEGVNDLVAVIVTSDSTVNGKPLNTKAYLLIGSINGNTVIAQLLNLNGGDPSTETVTEIFKAQVEKLKG